MSAYPAPRRTRPFRDPMERGPRIGAIRRHIEESDELTHAKARIMCRIAGICDYGDNPDGCFLGTDKLAEKCGGLHPDHLRRLIRELVNSGWLIREQNPVRRKSPKKYRTLHLGPRALQVLDRKDIIPWNPDPGAGGRRRPDLGAGGRPDLGAGGRPDPGAGGRRRRLEEASAPKGAVESEETTTTRGPSSSSSPAQDTEPDRIVPCPDPASIDAWAERTAALGLTRAKSDPTPVDVASARRLIGHAAIAHRGGLMWVARAIYLAEMQKGRTWAYILKILERWQSGQDPPPVDWPPEKRAPDPPQTEARRSEPTPDPVTEQDRADLMATIAELEAKRRRAPGDEVTLKMAREALADLDRAELREREPVS